MGERRAWAMREIILCKWLAWLQVPLSGLFHWKENEQGGDRPRPGAVLGIRGSAKLLF